MTNFYVTTGISTKVSSRCWKGLEKWRAKENRELLTLYDAGEVFQIVKQTREAVLNSVTDLGSARAAVARSFDPDCWDSRYRDTLPAELATLKLMNDQRLITANDRIIFLLGKSNQKEGWLLCAIYEAMHAAGSAVGNAEVKGPFPWDPSDQTSFDAGLHAAWGQVVGDLNSAFVFTGGYKAVLIALALCLATQARPARIYYLHEDGPGLVHFDISNHGVSGVTRTT